MTDGAGSGPARRAPRQQIAQQRADDRRADSGNGSQFRENRYRKIARLFRKADMEREY